MLEQYNLPLTIGKDALDSGLKMERLRIKANRINGLPDESIEDILTEVERNAEQK